MPANPSGLESSLARHLRLASRTLCLASVPIVVLAFWNPYFHPLELKDLLIAALGNLAFLSWWASRAPGQSPKQSQAFLPNPAGRPLFYLCLMALVSILWTQGQQLALDNWIALASLFLFLPPLFDFGKEPRFQRCFRIAILSTTMVLLVLAAFQLNGFSLGGLLRVGEANSRARLSLTIGHNNGVAPLMLLSSFLALSALAETRNRTMRWGYAFFTAACWVLILFFLLTRSTILGLLAGGILLAGINLAPALIRKTQAARSGLSGLAKWALVLGLAAMLVLVSAGAYMALKGGSIQGEYNPNLARNIVDRLRTFHPNFLLKDSRARLWAIGLVMMKHHPLLGLGYSSVSVVYPFYQAAFFEAHPHFPSGPTDKHTEALHNDYLQWGAECGAAGMVLLAWCFLVLGKTVILWLRGMHTRSPARWFSESAVLLALLALLMDGLFSFTAHIAPLAIYFPGLLMLWCGRAYQGKRQIMPLSNPVWLGTGPRLALAMLVWGLLAVPFTLGRGGVPLLTQTGIYSPVAAQVVGSSWHSQLSQVRVEFSRKMEAVRKELEDGHFVAPETIVETVGYARTFRERSERFSSLIPANGEAVFDAADAFYDVYRFYKFTYPYITRVFRDNGKIPQVVAEDFKQAPQILQRAGEFYEQTRRNYRYHGLYWLLGLVQLERVGQLTTSPELKKELIDTGRENLATARRIFFLREKLFQELDVGLRVGDEKGSASLAAQLVASASGYVLAEVIPTIAKKRIKKDEKTGDFQLDPASVQFFRILLPQLGQEHLAILRAVLPILDRGKALDLARQYADADRQLSKRGLYEPFWKLRLNHRPETTEELAGLMADYRRILAGNPHVPFLHRALYLSDLQRFAPPGADLSDWRSAVEELKNCAADIMTESLCRQFLAQDAISRGDLEKAWIEQLLASCEPAATFYPLFTERRLGVLNAGLWGITWPFLIR
jgi:O-antigen ligase